MPFHNPYHFVPVTPRSSSLFKSDDINIEEFFSEEPPVSHVTHEKAAAGTYSGRIICQLTTEEKLVIGAEQEEHTPDRPARIHPFQLEGHAAIPSTSLRGVFSSIAEAATNSSLRVLRDEMYSVRKAMDEGLSAIGMIVATPGTEGQNHYSLRPLALPTIELEHGTAPAKLPPRWAKAFPKPNLKVYLGHRNLIEDATKFPYVTWTPAAPTYYYMRLDPGIETWTAENPKTLNFQPSLHISNNRFLVAQNARDPKLFERPDTGLTRGIVRVLGCAGRDIPTGKKHELFVPYTEAMEEWPTLEIPDAVVERFHDLCDQRTEHDPALPYEPLGTSRLSPGSGASAPKLRIKDGDLVFFSTTPDGHKVAEISFSSIWRGRPDKVDGQSIPIEKATTHAFFRSVDPELLPLNPSRKVLTIAEQLFGVVEDRGEGVKRPAHALASRLRFSHALRQPRANQVEFEADVTLRILDSPKPPSPAFYFKVPNQGAQQPGVKKRDFRLGAHWPQGRKFYLHRWQGGHNHDDPTFRDCCIEPWRTRVTPAKWTQYSVVTPVPSNATFYFHVDFEGVSETELGLLLYCLRPSRNFRHKIGMGKPLGLGTVKIDIEGMFLVDRRRRYTLDGMLNEADGGAVGRYHSGWVRQGDKAWPERYSRESAAAVSGEAWEARRDFFAGRLNTTIKRAIDLIGTRGSLTGPVHAPANTSFQEEETFEWFVNNDKDKDRPPQALPPIQDADRHIATLEENGRLPR